MKKPFNPNKTAARLMKLPPQDWPAAVARLHPADQSSVVSSLDSLAERAASLAGWIDGGPKLATSRQVKVSRALGYSLPRGRGFTRLPEPLTR
jgi:hypothetical protein